jgi:hemerythrin-like domain-containing protein
MHTARASVRAAADSLADGPGPTADAAIRRALDSLTEFVLPHEHAEESDLYPALAEYLRDPEAMVAMSREHAEIDRFAERIRRHLEASPGGIQADQIDDLRATLYGLDAILTLHFAQEDEALFTLADHRETAPG